MRPPQADPDEAQATAEAVREQMYGRDRAAQALGISVQAIGPGSAACRMPVRDDMLNGHATCHGGLIFTLADTAFAYACNAGNRATVVRPWVEIPTMANERRTDHGKCSSHHCVLVLNGATR